MVHADRRVEVGEHQDDAVPGLRQGHVVPLGGDEVGRTAGQRRDDARAEHLGTIARRDVGRPGRAPA